MIRRIYNESRKRFTTRKINENTNPAAIRNLMRQCRVKIDRDESSEYGAVCGTADSDSVDVICEVFENEGYATTVIDDYIVYIVNGDNASNIDDYFDTLDNGKTPRGFEDLDEDELMKNLNSRMVDAFDIVGFVVCNE